MQRVALACSDLSGLASANGQAYPTQSPARWSAPGECQYIPRWAMDDKAPLIDRCLSVDVRFVAVRYFEMASGFGCLFHLQRVSGYGRHRRTPAIIGMTVFRE